MKQYQKNGEIKRANEIILKIGNSQIINPTKEQLIANGWAEYKRPTQEIVDMPIDEQRKYAYQAECDQYLIAYQGYMLEGNVEKAEEQKQLYLAKKQEIRKRFEQDATR
jgi:hypothetical protein